MFSRPLLHPTLKLLFVTRGSWYQALVHTVSSHNKLITSPTALAQLAKGQSLLLALALLLGCWAQKCIYNYTVSVCLCLDSSEHVDGKVGLVASISLEQQDYALAPARWKEIAPPGVPHN